MKKTIIRVLTLLLVSVMCFSSLNVKTRAVISYTGNSTSDSAIESHAIVIVSNAGKVGGIIGGAAGFGSDIYSVSHGLTAQSSAGKAVQGLLFATDMTFAMLGICVGIMVVTGAVAVTATIVTVVALCGAISTVLTGWLTSEGGGHLLDSLFGYEKVPKDVNAYKPNIYFYSEQDKDISVSFDNPELLTNSIPHYENSWNFTLQNNIIVCDDGQYSYLFYESVTDPVQFNYESAFVISRENRAETFRNILTEYNFTKQEIDDFIDFWVDKLDSDKIYLMFAQNTEMVDQAMPVNVNPVPESINRIWFAFTTVQMADILNPDFNLDPVIEPIVRNGYTMVEWGGFIVE